MKISEIVSAKIEKLPLEKQQEVLDFIEFLQSKIEPDTIDKHVLFLEVAKEITTKQKLAGSMKGTFILPLSKDFDEPLEEFEDYM
ncbi:type II toxin-antitoxin system VapB family antitoxin [Crocosphaera chwakensis]|uniref:DUF2281 domain-containing protein n=1 Tax=Crocosphaera chwakensis CCY0110 TaxID=391612 RepID=A3IT48_9CHRO|nr:DUF2281 domain-containing protein [Crocosphaera chwakensis]EAZ90352.1 hypothetical protein CY0110_04778 [Crocosphaera chwakensis CCY0110]